MLHRFCESLKAFHNANFQQTCNFYATQALGLIRGCPDRISLPRIQALLMLGLHDCTDNEGHRGWMHIGTAVRLAQALKLGHLDDDDVQTTNYVPHGLGPSKSLQHKQAVIDYDIQRRTFWACFLIERLFSDCKDQPVIINVNEGDITTRFPSPDNEFIMGKPVTTARFSTELPPAWAPASKRGLYSMYTFPLHPYLYAGQLC